MSNAWNTLAGKLAADSDNFNTPVSGGAYMGIGEHSDVFIEGVERDVSQKGNPYIKVIWSDDEGRNHNDFVMLYGKTKEGGQGFHFAIRRLFSGLIADETLRLAYFNKLVNDPSGEGFDSLRGLRASLKIGQGRSGYTVKETPTGGYVIYDVEDKENVVEDVYETYTDAVDAAKEMGLKRAYPEVKAIKLPSEEYVNANEAAASSFVEAGSAGAKGGNVSKPHNLTRSSI